jgi:hypothetical protein
MSGGIAQHDNTPSNVISGSFPHAGLVQLPDSPSADVFTETDKGSLEEQEISSKVVSDQQNSKSYA